MGWLSKKQFQPLAVDIHSHLIPRVDDGSQSVSDSIDMLRAFQDLGYKKIITTPHIHPRYPNTERTIMEGFKQLQNGIKKHQIEIEVEVAAEYYVDDLFTSRIKDDSLLSFGNKLVLVECSFINRPLYFEKAIFEIQAQGYRPVLAHPERYSFLEEDISWLLELRESGVLFQITLGSLSGYYGKQAQKTGMKLLKQGLVDFLASDVHRISQFEHLKKGLRLKEVQKLIQKGELLDQILL